MPHGGPARGRRGLLEGDEASVRLALREGVPRAPDNTTLNVNGKYPAREHYIKPLLIDKTSVGHPDTIKGR